MNKTFYQFILLAILVSIGAGTSYAKLKYNGDLWEKPYAPPERKHWICSMGSPTPSHTSTVTATPTRTPTSTPTHTPTITVTCDVSRTPICANQGTFTPTPTVTCAPWVTPICGNQSVMMEKISKSMIAFLGAGQDDESENGKDSAYYASVRGAYLDYYRRFR